MLGIMFHISKLPLLEALRAGACFPRPPPEIRVTDAPSFIPMILFKLLLENVAMSPLWSEALRQLLPNGTQYMGRVEARKS